MTSVRERIIGNIVSVMTYAELRRAVLRHGEKIGVYKGDSIDHDRATPGLHLAVDCLTLRGNREVYSSDPSSVRRKLAVQRPEAIFVLEGKNSIRNDGKREIYSLPRRSPASNIRPHP